MATPPDARQGPGFSTALVDEDRGGNVFLRRNDGEAGCGGSRLRPYGVLSGAEQDQASTNDADG
jgi:hypothetical protein